MIAREPARSLTMDRAFQKFVDQLTESTEPHVLQQSMADLTAALNLSCFAYLSLAHEPGGAPKLISTYPTAWTAYYLRRKYASFDPVVRQAVRHTRPFRWGLDVRPRVRSEAEHELFEEAASFGIRHGFAIPIHDSRGQIATVTFAADRLRVGFERSIEEHANVLISKITDGLS